MPAHSDPLLPAQEAPKKVELTTIALSPETKDKLAIWKGQSDSWEDALLRLLNAAKLQREFIDSIGKATAFEKFLSTKK